MRVLEQAGEIVRRRWGTLGKGWKVLMAIGIVAFAGLAFVMLSVWFAGKVLGALSVKANQNSDLYFPKVRVRR